MNFSEFAKTLEEFYKGENSQADFTKELLCKIVNNEYESKIGARRLRFQSDHFIFFR